MTLSEILYTLAGGPLDFEALNPTLHICKEIAMGHKDIIAKEK